jgi:tRNA (adenine37-N6)-methyltransferase
MLYRALCREWTNNQQSVNRNNNELCWKIHLNAVNCPALDPMKEFSIDQWEILSSLTNIRMDRTWSAGDFDLVRSHSGPIIREPLGSISGGSFQMGQIQVEPIGFVSSPASEAVDHDWGQVASVIELKEQFRGGLQGLEQFSHALVVTYLHKASFEPHQHLQRCPRDLEAMPKVGVFSQRAKHRPNPIGVTAVQIIAVHATLLEVKGLDAIDGTPVLDIKPYYPDYDRVGEATVPQWVNDLMEGYF